MINYLENLIKYECYFFISNLNIISNQYVFFCPSACYIFFCYGTLIKTNKNEERHSFQIVPMCPMLLSFIHSFIQHILMSHL